MSAPDCFLVAWWVAAAAVGIAIVVFAMRSGREVPRTPHATWCGIEMPKSVRAGLMAASALLVAGGLALFFMGHWTRWLLLNSQIFMVVVGASLTVAGVSGRLLTNAPRDWPRAITIGMRIAIVLFSFALAAVGCVAAFKDVASPRRVVEGHVDSVDTHSYRRSNTEYRVVIDGRRFRSTFEAFVHIQPDRHVRVEVGAGSGMILAAEDNALRPIERRRRN